MNNYTSPLLKLSKAVNELETAEVSATLFFGWVLHSELHREWVENINFEDCLDPRDFESVQVLDYPSFNYLRKFVQPHVNDPYEWIRFGQHSHPSWALIFRDYCYSIGINASGLILRDENLQTPNVQAAWEEMKKHLSVKVMEYLGKPEWRLVAYRGF